MKNLSSKLVLLTTTVLGAVAAPPVLAQGASNENSNTIIVTARRTEERLQDVPISITVFSQQQLSNRNIVTATDLGTYTPSLSVNQRFGPEKSSFSIRGFVQENSTAPSVGVYFADVVAPRAQGGTTSGGTAPVGSFMDLQNVQVLKGPQGTLFGRNTTGGAVLLVPQKPTGKFEGYVEGSLGDYNLRRIQGVLNIPLAETFKVRLAVDRNQVDGYVRNHSGIGPDDYNDINYVAARFSVIADLTPNLENYMIATYSHSFSHGYGARIAKCNTALLPQNGFVPMTGTQLALAVTGPSACDQLDRQAARGDGPLDVEIDNPDPKINLRQWQVINTTTWRASDTLTIKNIASYAEIRERASYSLNGDNFFVSNPPPAGFGAFRLPTLTPGTKYQYIVLNPFPGGDNASQSTLTEELQFQGQLGDGRFIWQAGGYLELSRPLGFSIARTSILLNCTRPETLDCSNSIFIGTISQSATKASFTDKGLYAQGTYKFTDQLSLTAGIRYTIDETRVIAENLRVSVPSTLRCSDLVRFPDSSNPTTGMLVTDQSQCRQEFIAESEKPTWLIDIDYKPTDDILIYAKYARGYRQGGANPTNIAFETWGPEKVDSYEIGAKATFRGAVNGSFNIAGFYNDFANQQLVANGISSVPGFSGTQPVVNAGKSRIQGVEVDASLMPFEGLRFDLGYTYLDTKLQSITLPPFPNPPYSALIPTAVVGGPLALSPKNRVTLTGTYTLPLDESVGEISFGATFTHTDSQVFTQASLPEFNTLPATDLLNLNLNWQNVLGNPVDAALFVTNVTNEIYPVAVGSSWFSAGFENLLYGAPRMWGVRLRYRFGS